MRLPLVPPIEPMLARSAVAIPPGMAYEPKWDGFRCLVFRDNDEVVLLSRQGRDLSVFFPEVVSAVLDSTPPRCVLDGELVVVQGARLDFVKLTERIHPAGSRIAMLSHTTPASLVCWDLLALDDTDLTQLPFSERRRQLDVAMAHSDPPVHLTPITTDVNVARQWFDIFEGAGLDGVVCKALDGPYLPGRRAMIKVKHKREADVVVVGYRLHKNSTPGRPLLGSLQLGLYDDQGQLHWVGVSSAFPDLVRVQLADSLGQLRLTGPADGHPWSATAESVRRPGTVSRWTQSELREVHLINPMLVCTVGYEHMEGTRFRNTTRFVRWRPDREPRSCTFDQLDEVVSYDLARILGESP